MRPTFLLILSFFLFSLTAPAQNDGASQESGDTPAWQRISMGFNVVGGFEQHHVTPLRFEFNAGYEFVPRLYAFFHAENFLGLYKQNGDRIFYRTQNLGGGLGFRLLGGKDGKYAGKLRESLDLRLMAGGSVGSCDWKQTFYDAGLQYYYRGGRALCTPVIGLGYRFTDSRTAGRRDQHTVYASIGLRF